MKAFLLLSLLSFTGVAWSQIGYTGGVYSQDFDTLPGTTNNLTGQTWTDNATLAGWYSSHNNFGITDGTMGGSASAFDSTSVTANIGLFSFGTAASTDRALGSRATSTGSNNPVIYGVRLVNNTSQTLTKFTITYTGEQWFASTQSAAHTLLLDYQVGATGINSGTWSAVTAGTFTAPITTGTTARALSGNTTANRTVKVAVVTGVSWAPGQELWIRFRDTNESGNEQGLAVDDFSFLADDESALFFNGSSSYVTMGFGTAAATAFGASDFTLECRVLRTGPGVTASTGTGGVSAVPLIARGVGEADGNNRDANYFIGIDANGHLTADFEQLNATSNGTAYAAGQNFPATGSTVLQNGVWYHVAVSYNSTTAAWKMYVNGVEETTVTTPIPPFVGVVPRNDSIQGLGIGTTVNSTGARSGFFQGIIDEARIWNVVRTPAEILANKDEKIASGQTGLLARYGFDEGTGTTAAGIAASGPATSGTLSGTVLPAWVNASAFVPTNVPPSVTLTSPADGTVASLASGVDLAATASDLDGTVTQVEFLRDGSVIHTDTSAPFAFTDTGVTAGLHAYSARATDNVGATTTSGTVNVSILTDPTKTALRFDGVNDYVTMGAAPELGVGGPPSNGMTVECWFYKEGTGVTSSSGNGGVAGVPLVCKGRGEAENSNVDCDFFFGINTSGLLVADFEAYPASGITAGQNYPITGTHTAIANNAWHHAAATYDGDTATWTLYLDGVAAGTASTAAGALPRYDSIQHFSIGAALTSAGAAEGAFAGRIDEVRVWNYARSSGEIAAAKDYEIAMAPGLVGRYGLNEGGGTTTANHVGVAGAPIGTLTNGPIWVDGAPLAANTAPVVALTAPADDTTVKSGSIVSLTATASDGDGIARVEFYADSTKLGEDTTEPFAFNWSTSATGDFVLTAKAFDSLGTPSTSSSVTIHVIPNVLPTVSITAPADNTTLMAPATVDITANANDADGSVTKVEFFNGSTKLGEDTAAPFAFHWTTIPAGDHTLTAKATDDIGAVTTSAAITLHVSPPDTLPPVVAISAPANDSSFAAPATINLTATASDPDGTVVKVEFFNGAAKLGEDTSAPFTYAWTDVPAGDYTITAKATDDMTATTTSVSITVHVTPNQPPVVTLTAPADHATGIGSSTTISASIADPEGDAQTVRFYGRLAPPATPGPDFTIATLPDTQFYSENLNNNGRAATYHAQTQWLADNRDSLNLAFVSHMGDIVQNGDAVPAEWLVADGAMQRVEDQVSTLRAYGIPWGGAPGNHDQTSIGNAGGANAFYNQYFGTSRFIGRPYWGGSQSMVNNNNNYQLFSASGLDFVILHLEYDTRSAASYQAVMDWADSVMKAHPNRRAIVTSHWIVNTGNPASFSTQGQNLYDNLKDNPNFFLMLCGHVAGEGRRSDTFQGRTVHSVLQDYQSRANGGDGWLRYFIFSPANNTISARTYRVANPLNPAAGTFETDADSQFTLSYDMQGALTDWMPLGTANVAAGGTTASLNWTGLEAGKDYEWHATSDDGIHVATSGTRSFSTSANAAPTVAITTPTNNASFNTPATVNITATANDSDGTITKVEFYEGNTKLGEDSSAPYEHAWNGVATGSYTLSAIAVDNGGAATLSALVSITVTNPGNMLPVVAITSPANSATIEAGTIALAATASDSDGTIDKVEFYEGATKLGEDTTSPYTFNWTGVTPASYSLTAVATDNDGATTTSGVVAITVVPAGSFISSYTQNFDAMGASGTAPPAGWTVWNGPGTSNTLWTAATGIIGGPSDTAGSVGQMTLNSSALTVSNAPTANANNGYNAGAPGNSANRMLGSAPTSVGGMAFQLELTNSSGAPISNLSIAYDIQRFTTVGTVNDLPGYWLFYSVDNGATWTNVSQLNPVISGGAVNVPNTTGVTNVPPTTVNLASPWAAGGTLRLRWVDDNAQATSPDQIHGLDNLSIILPQPAPTVALTAPTEGASIARPGPVNLTAAAADANGTVAKVEFFAGATRLGEDVEPPYEFAWSGMISGAYVLTAKATDNDGATTTSTPVNITVTNPGNVPPAVAIVSPANGGTVPASTLTITATASDTDGLVSKVEFFVDATKLGEDATAPYSFDWTSIGPGMHTLTAKAADNDGGVTTSAAVTVEAVAFTDVTSIARGATWKYLDDGTNQGIAWKEPAFDDSTWAAAPAVLGYGDTHVVTTLSKGPASPNQHITYYFRRSFTITNAAEVLGLKTSLLRDDGAVVYINGVEVARSNMAEGAVDYLTVAPVIVSGTDETTYFPITLPTGVLVTGNNVIAVELHQRDGTSSDLGFDLDLITTMSGGNALPSVQITSPAANATFFTGDSILITASAADSDGAVTKVEFFQGATKLGEDTSAPYEFRWDNVPAGSLSLTAVATDNFGSTRASAAVPVTVTAGPSGTLTRAAYLQQAGPNTMTIRWRSSQSIAGRVKYGASAASLTSIADEASAKTDHEITLTGLAPSTTYFYSIGSASDTLAGGDAAHTFTTPPTPGSTPSTRIWVLGDAGTGTASQASVRDAFYTWTGARDPNLVLELGDNAYNTGTDSEFQAKVFDIYGSLMKRVPFWSCLGNHETGQATAFVDTYPYFSIYTFPKAGECGGVPSGSEHYFSFDHGNIHVISLDSMTASRSPTGAMATWVTNDLASTTATWIICIFHHPPYTKGSHNSDTETELMQMRANILPILEAGGVDLVLCGHSHCYERSYLLDGHYGLSGTLTSGMKKNAGDGRPAGNGAYIKPLTGPRDHFGAVYAVAGSSGQISGGSLNHPAHFISLNNLGSLVLDVNGARLDATFIRENGSLPDTFTIIKQGAADSDNDGIPDEYEIAAGLNRFSSGDAHLDDDHDGLDNMAEFLFGLLPNKADRYQWSSTLNETTGDVDVTFPTLPGRVYQVFWSDNLIDWHPASIEITGDGNDKTWSDDGTVTGATPATAGKRFYQVKISKAP